MISKIERNILEKIDKTQLRTPKDTYTVDYEWAVKLTEKAQSIHWLATEINVDNDIQDLRTNFTGAEYHGTVFALKVFTKYEMEAGHNYWLGRILNRFQRPADIQRMAATFGYFESSIHSPFYQALNEALNLNTDEFYNSYVEDEGLKARMEFIGEYIGHDNDLISIATFSMIEGAVLYSSFAFLKSFQANGRNKLKSVVSGVNFSHKDEDIHNVGGAMLYKQLLEESKLNKRESEYIERNVIKASQRILEHEEYIISMMFSEGEISGITQEDLLDFVKHRLNLCLSNLGIDKQFDEGAGVISDWYYKGINAITLHDFFAKVGNEYNANCNREVFDFNENYDSKQEETK